MTGRSPCPETNHYCGNYPASKPVLFGRSIAMGKDKPPGALALQGLSDRRSQVHPPAQRSKTEELIQPIMNRIRRRRVTGVAIFRLKAIG